MARQRKAEIAGVLDTPARPVPVGAVAALLAERHGLAGRFEPLPGERDQNLRLDATDGRRYVVKIANPAEDPAVIDFQSAALSWIARADPALPVPRVVAALDGGVVTAFDDGAGERLLRVLTFLDGVPMRSVRPAPAQHAALGRIAGRLLRALERFAHPADGHVLLWDLARAADLRSRLPVVDASRRDRIARILDRFDAEVAPRLARLPSQVVHNDFNPHNLLVDPDDPDRIAGVIDFGDMVRTARAADIAVAASYLLRHPGGIDAAAAFVAAVGDEVPLLPDEVSLLPDLMATRLAAAITISEWRAAGRAAERDYILRNHAGAVAGLDLLETAGQHAFARRLADAVGGNRR
jgi:Ser/Thr protein kinase RdoA (MazF antagonist)